MNKKVLSILLTLAMIFTVIPVKSVAAATTEEGTVYLSASHDSQYVLDTEGNPVAYSAVTLEELASIQLENYGLEDLIYDGDGDGTPDITVLHLFIYIHENVMGLDWGDVNLSAYPGSIYFQDGLFGFEDENLRYDVNGSYPAVDGWGMTADQIVLSDGDFVNVAHYSSWSFWGDSMTGFLYFADQEENLEHVYQTSVNQELEMGLVRSYSDWMNGGASAFVPKNGYKVSYGTVYGEAIGTTTTDDNGHFTLTFPSKGTWYVWADGDYGLENSSDIVSSPAFATVNVQSEPADPIEVSVSLSNKGEVVMAKQTITVRDLDESGDFNVDEVLYAAHEQAYQGGAATGYASEETSYGLSITKLWGDVSGNYGYWLNDASCWSLKDTVKQGDNVVAFVYQNTEVWDSYAKFDRDCYTSMAEAATNVTLEKAGYDANWNTVFVAHQGANLKVYDNHFQELATGDYQVVDNGDGTYAVTVKTVGEYTVVAYDNHTPIVPAICMLSVKQNPDLVYADAVEAKIEAIGTVTSESREAIEEAREAYNALTDAQKKLVSNYDVLVLAEETLKGINADLEAAKAVEQKIASIGTVNIHSCNQVSEARKAYEALTDSQESYVENLDVLTAAEGVLVQLYEKAAQVDHREIYEQTGSYMNQLGTPTVGSVGGEWMVIDLTRSGYDCPEGYYQNVVDYVNAKINEKEQLHRAKSTDNSRVILGLTSAGYDVTDVDGHNLLMGLTDMTYLKKQGINGPIWALIAFDSHHYEIPVNETAEDQVTRDKIISYILEKQLEDGGWALSGTVADPDMTGMAMQALAPYYEENVEVKAAVNKAIQCLSEKQYENGGFGSIDGTCSESCAQVIVALTALGIDPETDARFVKNGVSVVDAMCLFALAEGGFEHIPDGGLNGMATEQGQYALAAYFRFLEGKTSLYDMSDVTIRSNTPDNKDDITGDIEKDDQISGKPEDSDSNKDHQTQKPEGSDQIEAPQTGDSNVASFYITWMGCGLLAFAVVTMRKKFRK